MTLSEIRKRMRELSYELECYELLLLENKLYKALMKPVEYLIEVEDEE